MDIKIYEATGSVLIRLRGRIVLDECDRLKATISEVIHPGVAKLNLDLSGVDFVDSAGLGALVGIKVSSSKHRARLALINPSRGVSDILMVSKLDSIFDIVTGTEAEELIRELAQPQFEKSLGGEASGPQLRRGPAMPAMPSAGKSAALSPTLPAAAAGSKELVDRLCREAVNFMRQGDYERAAGCYEQVIEADPNYLPAHNNLAIVCERVPQWRDRAITQWERVLEMSRQRNDEKHIERAEKHLQTLRSQ